MTLVPLCDYELEREVYQAEKLGFLDPEPELEHSPFVHRQSRWSRFWTSTRRFFKQVVEEVVDR